LSYAFTISSGKSPPPSPSPPPPFLFNFEKTNMLEFGIGHEEKLTVTSDPSGEVESVPVIRPFETRPRETSDGKPVTEVTEVTKVTELKF